MAETNEWEAVRDSSDRRKVVYWRFGTAKHRFGAVSRRDGQWRALGYGWSTPSDNVELGMYPTRRRAERAVLDHAEASYAPHDICETCNVPARQCGHRAPESREWPGDGRRRS